MAIRAEHEEAVPLVEDPSGESLGRFGAGRHVVAAAIALVALVGLGSMAVRTQSGTAHVTDPGGFIFFQEGDATTTTTTTTTTPKMPPGKQFILDSVLGPITTIFIPEADIKKSTDGLQAADLQKLGDQELQNRLLIAKSSSTVPSGCDFCAAAPTTNNVCCYEIISGQTTVNPKTKELQEFLSLSLRVIFGYDRYLDNTMVKYVRDMKGVNAEQRAKTADELRKNGILDQKQLSSLQEDPSAMLTRAGLEGPAVTANAQTMNQLKTNPAALTEQEQTQKDALDKQRADAQTDIDDQMAKANAERDQSKADAQALYDEAKQEADAEMQKVKAQAQADLDKTTAKLAELELGSADLKAEETDLKSQVDAELQGATELTKGVKLNTWQLIQRNAIFGGRQFHGGISQDDARIRFDVCEFTADALASLPNPSTGTKWTDANVAGGSSSSLKSATVVSAGYSKDYLASMVTRGSPDSSSEYSFSVTNSQDERMATRMFETYGSSASEFTQKEGGFGMSFGIPGVFSAGGGFSKTTSKSTASSTMGENDRSARYSQTGTQFTQVEFYEEPRMVVMVPRTMLQATGQFSNYTRAIYALLEPSDAHKRIFAHYGTHICPKVTLGGRWRVTARATSLTATKYASLSEATSQAISETTASGTAGQMSGGAQVGNVSGATATGASSGEASSEEETAAAGAADKSSAENRDTTVQVQQKWTGGQSGGTPAAWRASLQEEENSNWKVLKFNFMDCIPVWAFYAEDLVGGRQKVSACIYWYYNEIQTSPALDEEAQEALMQEVPRKCIDDPDTTYMGPLAEAFKKGMVREQERQALVDVKKDEYKLIAYKHEGKTSCQEVVKVSSMHPTKGLKNSGECVQNQPLKSCQGVCETRDKCRGFWLSNNGNCCPKETWDSQYETNMDSDPGWFYQCSAATNAVNTIVLTAKSRTDWGSWGNYERCKTNKKVVAIKQKLEIKGDGDNTALNGIKLKCEGNTEIVGTEQKWGNWGDYQSCEEGQFMVGYYLRSVEWRGGDKDDYGAIGIKGECNDGKILHADDYPARGWDQQGTPALYARCPPGYFISGLKTRIENSQGGGDDTALTDVMMECVKVPKVDVVNPFVGSPGSICSKFTALDDAADCMEAASLMDLSWQHDESSPYMPSGCYAWGQSDSQQYSVYFNTAAEPDLSKKANIKYSFTSLCYEGEVPFVFKFSGCPVNENRKEIEKTPAPTNGNGGSDVFTFEQCSKACQDQADCTGFEIGGCARARDCSGTCKLFTESPDNIINGGCDDQELKTYVTVTTPTTTASPFYTFIGAGVVKPEKWQVGDLSTGSGVEACYEAAITDPECVGGYFMYSARGLQDCGCTKEGTQEIASAEFGKTADYYKFTTTTTTTTVASDDLICGCVGMNGVNIPTGFAWPSQNPKSWAGISELWAKVDAGEYGDAITQKKYLAISLTENQGNGGNSYTVFGDDFPSVDEKKLPITENCHFESHTVNAGAKPDSKARMADGMTTTWGGTTWMIYSREIRDLKCPMYQTTTTTTEVVCADKIVYTLTYPEAYETCLESSGGRMQYTGTMCGENKTQIIWTSMTPVDIASGKEYSACFVDWATNTGQDLNRDAYGGSCGVTPTKPGLSLLPTICRQDWYQPLPEGKQCHDEEDLGSAVLHWLYSGVTLDECKRTCDENADCSAINYRAATLDCATYNSDAMIFGPNPALTRTETGWICYTTFTTTTTIDLAVANCKYDCSDLFCNGGWQRPLPEGDQCNDKEDEGPGILHWVYMQSSLDECKQKCIDNSVCAALAYQNHTLDCALYNENATILAKPMGTIRKEAGWDCYTKQPTYQFELRHSSGDKKRWKRGPFGPKGTTAPLGEEPYNTGTYEVLFDQTSASCQSACACRSWCFGFTFVSGEGYQHVDFKKGDCQLVSRLEAMNTTLDGLESYRKIACNPNQCDGLVCKPNTAIEIENAGGKTEINYGQKDDEKDYIAQNVSSAEDCRKKIGRIYAFEVRYAAYTEPFTCRMFGNYYADAILSHNDTGNYTYTVQKAWVQQRAGICCVKDAWDCCGTGDHELTQREHCPRGSALCSDRKCTQDETCDGEPPLEEAESC